MSFTRAQNPRTIGRGAPRGGRQPRGRGQTTPWQEPPRRLPPTELPNSVSETDSDTASGATSCPYGSHGVVEERTESHRAYTMIAPKEEKRRSILEKARAEEDNYRRYKETQKMGHVSCGGTVGGASCGAPATSARQRQRTSAFNSKQKSQQFREEEKRLEEVEINRKKMEQRRKTDMNEREEKERQERLRQDHRRRNDEFLRNLEKR